MNASSITTYCFDFSVSLSEAEKKLEEIKHPNDRLTKKRSMNCLEIEGSQKRANLYEAFLEKRFKLERTYKNEYDLKEEVSSTSPCNIHLKRTSNQQLKKNTFSLGKKNTLKQNQLKNQKTSVSQLLIDSGRTGTIRVDNYRVRVKCQNLGRRFKLDIELEHSSGGVGTSLTVTSGQEVNLGSIVDELNDKQKILDVKNGLSQTKTSKKVQSHYSISVK